MTGTIINPAALSQAVTAGCGNKVAECAPYLLCGECEAYMLVVALTGAKLGGGEFFMIGGIGECLHLNGHTIVVCEFFAVASFRGTIEPVSGIDLHSGKSGAYFEDAA